MSEYQPLNISEFVCGYIEKVKLYQKIQEDLYAHIQLLIGKAMTYSWNCVEHGTTTTDNSAPVLTHANL